MQYVSAEKGSTSTPCRNVPIFCTLCVRDPKPVIWRYNFLNHLEAFYKNVQTPNQPDGVPMPADMWSWARLSDENQAKAHIPEAKHLKAFYFGLTAEQDAAAHGEKWKAQIQGGGSTKRTRRT